MRRCDFKKVHCDDFGIFVIPDLCNTFEQRNKIWSDIVAHTKPRPKCPLKKGNLQIVNATVNFNYMRNTPFARGYRWILFFRSFKSINKSRQNKRLVFCYFADSIAKDSHKN